MTLLLITKMEHTKENQLSVPLERFAWRLGMQRTKVQRAGKTLPLPKVQRGPLLPSWCSVGVAGSSQSLVNGDA